MVAVGRGAGPAIADIRSKLQFSAHKMLASRVRKSHHNWCWLSAAARVRKGKGAVWNRISVPR